MKVNISKRKKFRRPGNHNSWVMLKKAGIDPNLVSKAFYFFVKMGI